ncbi:MAG: uracil-DNA glycosylase [Elusimicrobia bacterium]|nr:uracil-DNA glycosylase [Candidatus Liberimonas magnetica]
MKRQEFSKILKLAKASILDEKNWGEFEVITKPSPKKPAKDELPKIAKPEKKEPGNVNNELDDFNKKISGCKKCPLGETRLNFVFGVGNPNAKLMFIGEGPGFDEDHQGVPFVGKAGQLLTKIIEAMGFNRNDVYICNIVKCHPMIDSGDPEKRGNDRPPGLEEINSCIGYLEKQIEIIRPDCICVLGNVAAKALLKTETGISKLRGTFCEYNGIKVMPTYHPAALLRTPSLKKDVWEDMKKVRNELNKK